MIDFLDLSYNENSFCADKTIPTEMIRNFGQDTVNITI